MQTLPDDILSEILRFINPKAGRLVCKKWRELTNKFVIVTQIDDPLYIDIARGRTVTDEVIAYICSWADMMLF